MPPLRPERPPSLPAAAAELRREASSVEESPPYRQPPHREPPHRQPSSDVHFQERPSRGRGAVGRGSPAGGQREGRRVVERERGEEERRGGVTRGARVGERESGGGERTAGEAWHGERGARPGTAGRHCPPPPRHAATSPAVRSPAVPASARQIGSASHARVIAPRLSHPPVLTLAPHTHALLRRLSLTSITSAASILHHIRRLHPSASVHPPSIRLHPPSILHHIRDIGRRRMEASLHRALWRRMLGGPPRGDR